LLKKTERIPDRSETTGENTLKHTKHTKTHGENTLKHTEHTKTHGENTLKHTEHTLRSKHSRQRAIFSQELAESFAFP